LRNYLVGSLVVVVLLMLATGTPGSSGPWSVLDESGKMAQVYGAYVWAYLVLVAALVVVLRRPSPRTDGRGLEVGVCAGINRRE
jgi:hypothetical protein